MWSKLSRHARGYGAAWTKARALVLERDRYLCRTCLKVGRVHVADEVDHIIPKAQGGTDALSNLEAICKQHHAEKTARENGSPLRKATGIEGWPV